MPGPSPPLALRPPRLTPALVRQASKCKDDDCCVDTLDPNHSNNYAGCKDGYVFASGGPGSCWDGGAQYEKTLCCPATTPCTNDESKCSEPEGGSDSGGSRHIGAIIGGILSAGTAGLLLFFF